MYQCQWCGLARYKINVANHLYDVDSAVAPTTLARCRAFHTILILRALRVSSSAGMEGDAGVGAFSTTCSIVSV